MTENPWYTNKDLYEMIVKSNDDLKNEISQSNKEMRQEIVQSNKDLREMISSLVVDSSKFRKELDGLTTDLAVTRQEIKTYNNLRSTMNNCMAELQTVKNEVQEHKHKSEGKKAVASGIITWTGWGIMIITLMGKALGWW